MTLLQLSMQQTEPRDCNISRIFQCMHTLTGICTKRVGRRLFQFRLSCQCYIGSFLKKMKQSRSIFKQEDFLIVQRIGISVENTTATRMRRCLYVYILYFFICLIIYINFTVKLHSIMHFIKVIANYTKSMTEYSR